MYNQYKIDNNFYKVGLSIRLSREDGDDEESESVSNQRTLLLQFISNLGANYQIIDIYIDDGYSGLNFNRPDFKRMISDIENKKINMVVTKDLSRLGRDYIETGHYIERYFPSKNVRYIAVNDNIDTFNDRCSGSDLMPFRLSMNDMYAKDISNKVRSALQTKKKTGLYLGSVAPYGYVKDPSNKHKLIPDSKTAPIVKKIFELYIAGYGSKTIADILTRENLPTPVLIKNVNSRLGNAFHPEIWKHTSILNIIKNRVYLGHLIQHTSQNLSYKIKTRKKVPESEWIISENTHEALIDQKTFDLAQQIKNKSNTYSESRRNIEYIFANLVYCKDCGARMTISYDKKRDRVSMNCNSYRKFSNHNICFSHFVNYTKLEKTVLSKIRELCMVYSDEEFEKYLKSNYVDPSKEIIERINTIKIKIERLKQKIDSLYEDKFNGIISIELFQRNVDKVNKEIKDLNIKLIEEEKEKIRILSNTKDSIDYKEIAKNFLNINSPTKEMINKIISKIYITKDKQIEIHYGIKDFNYILN